MTKKYYLIAVSLLTGLFIYLFYRTEKTVVNELALAVVSFDTYTRLKESVTTLLPLNEIIIYSLPGGLWVFCITLTSKPYYLRFNNRRINGVFIPIIFCIGLETFQLLNLTHGRFDPMDIYVYVVFWLMGIYMFKDESDTEDILTNVNGRTVFCFATYGVVYLSHVLA